MSFEAAKLGVQGAFALIIAFLTVRWALGRFKREKTWERRLSSYADLVSALSEMQLAVGRLIDEIEPVRGENIPASSELLARYKAARRSFESSTAVARLILSSEAHGLIAKLERDMGAIDEPDRWTALNLQYSLIEEALEAITVEGKESLGLGSQSS